METKTVYDYFAFGWTYKLLCDGCPQATNKQAIALIDNFLKFLEDNGCDVTLKAVRSDAVFQRTKIVPFPPDDQIDGTNSRALSTLIQSMDKTIVAELSLHEAHVLTEKRFELKHLTTNPDRLFGNRVFSLLPKLAQVDFAEAGKCVAFDRATAAAFHILRGTEGTLRYYYLGIVKRNRVNPLLWGPIIDHLRKRGKTPKPLLDALDNIRTNYRNPTDHPDKVFLTDEVQDLFGGCIGAVNLMIGDLERKGLVK